jgi:hypothetical protein
MALKTSIPLITATGIEAGLSTESPPARAVEIPAPIRAIHFSFLRLLASFLRMSSARSVGFAFGSASESASESASGFKSGLLLSTPLCDFRTWISVSSPWTSFFFEKLSWPYAHHGKGGDVRD